MTITKDKKQQFEDFGFRFNGGGVHLARTMMFADLNAVLDYCGGSATKESVARAVDDENCLGKPSAKSRQLAVRHLLRLYEFDTQQAIYRAFEYLWSRDEQSRPQLALLCAYARDPILRSSAGFIMELEDGQQYSRRDLEEFVDHTYPERYSDSMIQSAAQNLASTWTQSGHLHGRVKKVRHYIDAQPGAVAFAALLSYLSGSRGMLTFESEYIKLLDCSPATAIELAKSAARRGWIDVKHIGSVVEVAFPRILTAEELEQVRE